MGRHRTGVVEARHEVDGHAVAVGVEDGHRGVLDADGAVQQGHHRLARDLGVAVGHAHRRLLVQAGQELGPPVAAVVDDRLLQPLEARPAVRRAVLDVERPQHVHHVVRARTLHDVGVDGPRRGRQLRLARELGLRGRRRGRRRGGRGGRRRAHGRLGQRRRTRRRAGGGPLQETAAGHRCGVRNRCGGLLLHWPGLRRRPPPPGSSKADSPASAETPPHPRRGARGTSGALSTRDCTGPP